MTEFPEMPAESPWQAVSLAVESLPASVEAGEVLEFVVAVTNNSETAIDPGAECPGYYMNFGESAVSAEPVRSLLNCDEAETIPPGETERFAMEIDIPAGLELDYGSVSWRLEPIIRDSSSSQVPVQSSS